jgi:hypothetical protein
MGFVKIDQFSSSAPVDGRLGTVLPHR